ncbi:MAG: hypothetical protein DRI32_09345 [Chloroflexi bacterium]|nr:MAG: hypothetical protein DRI32_09345 [Chloroflexota bacterium]
MIFCAWARKGGQVQKMIDQAEIHRKVTSGKVEERREAVGLFRDNFANFPDKEGAWDDLHRLTVDEDSDVRRSAARALGHAFQYISGKQAWNDLIRLTADEDQFVRLSVAYALGHAFQYIPDKTLAWDDLIRLTADEDMFVRWSAADALGHAFQYISGKQAWNDLIRLTADEDMFVRWSAADALGTAFQHVPDKDEAWGDLHRLVEDKGSGVRWGAADALGTAFQHVPDKEEAWRDLIRLTEDEDSGVRVSANHSLGRASIFRATGAKSEEDFRKEMKNALEFFEKSSREATYSNPSKFCLPFYKSFYSLTFGKAGAEDNVQRYLAEAKSVSEGSENKETLLEAVENLANALSEAQKVTDFDATKSDLKAYMQYCNRAADLIGDAEERTPGAARVLRRGLPIIDDRIKKIISEIQEKSKAVCKETQDTILEDLGKELNRQGDNLSTIRDPIGLEKNFNSLQSILSEMCAKISEDNRSFACETLEKAKNEPFIEDRINLINIVLSSILTSIGEIKMSIKIEKIEKSGVQIGGAGNIQQIDAASDPPTPKPDKRKFTLREIVYGAIIDIAIHVLVIISIDHYLESSMDKIAPYLIITFMVILVITVFALHKLLNTKSS